MANPTKIRTRALSQLSSRGGIVGALKVLAAGLDGVPVEDAPLELVVTKAEVLVKGGMGKRAAAWIRKVFSSRRDAESRIAILKAAEPLLESEESPGLITYLWWAWASVGDPDECLNVSRYFPSLPASSIDKFRARCQELKEEGDAKSLGSLGLAHLGVSLDTPLTYLDSLRALARGDAAFAAHAVRLISNLSIAGNADAIWAAAEIHLNAGLRPKAFGFFRELVARRQESGIELLSQAIQSERITADEAEGLVVKVLEKVPESPTLRLFLVEKCRGDGRLHDARHHLMALVRSTTDPERLVAYLSEMDSILELAPRDLALRCSRAELLVYLGNSEGLGEALRDILEEAPERALRILELWLGRGGDALPDLLVIRAWALSALGRHDDTVALLGSLLAEPDLPEALAEPLGKLSSMHEGFPAYRLLLVRCLHMVGSEDAALDSAETLITTPLDEHERIHSFLSSAEFSPEASPRAANILMRCSLMAGGVDEALEILAGLVVNPDYLRSGLEYALTWKAEWISRTDRARPFASLLFRAGMTDSAIEVLDQANVSGPEGASDLAKVFDERHLLGRREIPLLLCRQRLQVASGRLEAAAATAMAIGEAGALEEEYRLLLQILEHEQTREFVLPRVLATSLRLGRPVQEILRHGEQIKELESPALLQEAYELLLKRDRRSGLGNDGMSFLGWCALELGRHVEAAGHFQRLLNDAPSLALDGLERVVRDRPDLDEVRAVLAGARRDRGEMARALELLEEAPERTEILRGVLGKGLEVSPPALDAWWLESAWLEDMKASDKLVEHLYLMLDLEGVDLDEADRVLVRIDENAQLTSRGLWLRAAIARKQSNSSGEVAVLSEILRLGKNENEAVFDALDSLRDKHLEEYELILDDLRLSAAGGSPERVIAATRSALDTPDLAASLARAAETLSTVAHDPVFTREREFEQARYDLGLALEDRELAGDAYARLLEHDSASAELRLKNSTSWREGIAVDLEKIVVEVDAMIEVGRALECVPLIRTIVGLVPEGAKRPTKFPAFTEARRLAETAVLASPDDLALRTLASDLAADAGDADIALDHALAAVREETRDDLLGHIEKLSARFPADPRFEMALALEICEPLEERENAAKHLDLALDRDSALCRQAVEAAERLAEKLPKSSLILSNRARAAVLMSGKDPKWGLTAVTCLRELSLADSERNEEALAGVDTVLSRRPEQIEGRFLREELLRKLGRPQEAITEIRREILKRVDDAGVEFRARTRLADALEEVTEFQDAHEEWRFCEALDPESQEIPLRARMSFHRRREFELGRVPKDNPLGRGFIALWAGKPEEALACAPPPSESASEPSLAHLALRGAALQTLGRHDQVCRELKAHLARIPEASPLSVFEKEFLFSLGRSCGALSDPATALSCLERLAREAPHHRAVRRMLDREYRLRAAGELRPLEVSYPLEEMENGEEPS